MSEVYKIEVPQAFGTQFDEIGIFSKRGALDYFRATLRAADAKAAYISPAMFAPRRIKCRRDAAEWLERLPLRTPWDLGLYGIRNGVLKEIATFRVTCYTVSTNWL